MYIDYIGNPDLEYIKPISKNKLKYYNFYEHIKRPIIFVSLGNVASQKEVFEELPLFDEVMKKAHALDASVRFYDPKKDRQIIGKGEQPDYFLPLSPTADEYYEILKRGGANIIKLEGFKSD